MQSSLLKSKEKNFFSSLNPSLVKDNKLFWKTVKPFFSNKGNLGQNIKLVEENQLPQNDQEIADELNSFFKNTVSNLEKFVKFVRICFCFEKGTTIPIFHFEINKS